MNAIRIHAFGGPEVLALEQIPDPKPGPGEVLVRIHAAGVNPVDTYFRGGMRPDMPLPYTPGSDGAGIVAAVGKDVAAWKPGDRVYGGLPLTGTYAEFALFKPEQLYALPEGAAFDEGAAIYIPYGTAYYSLFIRAKALPGETVLVHGASGAVGLAALQFARAAGLRVVGTAGSDQGRVLALEHGAHHVVDHRDMNHGEAVLDWTGGRGVDVVLEMLANVNLALDTKLIAHGGRIVVIGNRGSIEINPRELMTRAGVIHGVQQAHATPEERRLTHAAIAQGLAQRTLRPVISHVFPLAEAAEAHRRVMEPAVGGKIILKP
jgi:NADPH2:quinone reductase